MSNIGIEEQIWSHQKEIISFTQELVATPSVGGNETEVGKIIAKKLLEYGIKSQFLGENKKRFNLFSGIIGQQKGKILILNGHLDTVPAGMATLWHNPPFSGKVVGNRLYGRGAADMKGGLAAIVLTAIIIKKTNLKLNGSLSLVFTANEENPVKEETGIQYLIKKKLIKGSACVVAEPKENYINIGSRGVYRFLLRIKGRAAHTGRISQPGVNAVLRMAKVLLTLDKCQLSFVPNKFFPPPKISAGTVISGGVAPDIVPDRCESITDIRLSFGQTKEGVVKEINHLLAELRKTDRDLRIETKEIFYIPPAIISQNQPIVKLLKKATQEVLGFAPGLKVSGPAGDNNFLIKAGIPTVTFGPKGENFHAEDEFVFLDRIFKTSHIFVNLVTAFLG